MLSRLCDWNSNAKFLIISSFLKVVYSQPPWVSFRSGCLPSLKIRLPTKYFGIIFHYQNAQALVLFPFSYLENALMKKLQLHKTLVRQD